MKLTKEEMVELMIIRVKKLNKVSRTLSIESKHIINQVEECLDYFKSIKYNSSYGNKK